MAIDGIGSAIASLQGRIRPLFRSLGVAASGLSAQRTKMDAITANIANAETTRTDAGGPYRRQRVVLEAQAAQIENGILEAGRLYPSGTVAGELPLPPYEEVAGVRVAGVVEDTSEGELVYDPGHPDANADGYVRMPNVNLTEEIVDLMETRRLYEANATVLQAIKNMLQRAAQI